METVVVRDTKFGTGVSNEVLLNAAAKSLGYSFYSFWVIKWKPTGGEPRITLPPLPPPWLGLKANNFYYGEEYTGTGYNSIIFNFLLNINISEI